MSIRHVSEQRGSLGRWAKFSCSHFFQNVLEDYSHVTLMFHGGISLLDLLNPKNVQNSLPFPCVLFWRGASHLHDIGQDDDS